MNLQTLYSKIQENCFLLLDGAAIDNLMAVIYNYEHEPQYIQLYRDTEYYESMNPVSPCLVKVERSSKLLDWFLSDSNNTSNGIIINAKEHINLMHEHLITIIEAKLPNYDVVLFRFYDPIVLESIAKANLTSILDSIVGPASNIIWQSNKEFSQRKFCCYEKIL